MRRIDLNKFLGILLVFVVSVFYLSACGGSNSSSDSKKEESEPTSRVENTTDVEAELVGFDSNGITFSIVSKMDNVLFMPKTFEAEGKTFSIFDDEGNHNPQVTLKANDKDIDASIECHEGETINMFVALEGVSDYSNLKITVDETLYSDSGGNSYPIKDVVLAVVTK